jgi:hypothetical protein
MVSYNLVKNLIKNYHYEVAFNLLYHKSCKILYQSSYKTSGNRIRNVGGIFKGFHWDCEFINGKLFKININK